MSCYDELQPMKDPEEIMKRACQEAARKINREGDLTERERGLLMCVLGIREFSRRLQNSMDETGQVVAGFDERFSVNVLIPGDEIWDLVDELTECVLDGIGELERFDPAAAVNRLEGQALLDSLKTNQQSDRVTN